MTGALRAFPTSFDPRSLPAALEDFLPPKDPGPPSFTPWQRGIVKIVALQPFQDVLKDAVRTLADPESDPDILVEALLNHFSLRNPGFSHNWWHFRSSGLVLRIDEHGVRFSHPDDLDFAAAATEALAASIPRTLWSLTFLSAWPGGRLVEG
jgi:hypothetical protein